MKVRFLALVESDAPGVPFMPGQVIDVDTLTPSMRAVVNSGHAEIVREEPELATVGSHERAVTRPSGKRARA